MKAFRVVFTAIFILYFLTNSFRYLREGNDGNSVLRLVFIVMIILSFYKRSMKTWLFLLSFCLVGLFNVLSSRELYSSNYLVTDMSSSIKYIVSTQPPLGYLFLPFWHAVIYLVLTIVLLTKAGRNSWWNAKTT